MIEQFQFYNQHWVWPVCLIGILLWLLFLWKEYNSQLRGVKLYVRILAGFLAIFSLAIIALQPMTLQEIDKTEAILLTKNYDRDRLDSLEKAHPFISKISYKKTPQLSFVLDSIKKVYVLGNGIEDYDIWQFKNVSTQYLGAPDISGIVGIDYDREVYVGEALVIKGRYKNGTQHHQLFVEDINGKAIDSVSLGSEMSQKFDLAVTPKATGTFVYTIIEKDSLGAIVYTEPLPFIVKEKKPLQIFIVNTFPTFETKYLKNFLVDRGHQVVIRSQLTKGTYKFENYNREATSIYGFTSENIEDFDLIILDVATLKGLSRASLSALQQAIQIQGLGVFIQPEEGMNADLPNWVTLDVKTVNSSKAQLSDYNKKLDGYPFRFKQNASLQTIHTDQDQIISGYTHYGLGKIGSTALLDTYSLVLNGNEKRYASLWSDMISKVSKKEQLHTKWSAVDKLIYPDEPYYFEVESSSEFMTVINNNSSHIPLQGDLFSEQRWSGIDYPHKVGWNILSTKNDSLSMYQYYVYDTSNWEAMRAYQTIKNTVVALNSKQIQSEVKKVFAPVSLYWFFIVFVLTVSYLWASPRFGF